MPPKGRKELRRSHALLGEDEGFLRLSEVLTVYPIAARSWYRGIEEGKYPRPVKLGPRTSAWRVRDIRRLLESLDERTA